MLLFLLAAASLLATAGLSAVALRNPSPVSTALVAYLVAWAEIVFLTEVLSLFHGVRPLWYLVGHALLLAAAGAVWHKRGRPVPARPRLPSFSRRDHWPLLAFTAAVALGLLNESVIALGTAPNEWDSLVYHLSRAASWFHAGAVEYVEFAPTERLNAFPPNAEMGFLWTFAFLEGDGAAGVFQLVAQLATMAAIYGIARRIGFSRAAGLFSALLFPTFSQIALEAVTTKNDIVVASFVAAAVYFVYGREGAELPLAGLAIGLAVGTKLTALFAFPLLALIAVALLPRRRAAELAAWSALGFALVGAYGYALNLVETGSPLGDESSQGAGRPQVTAVGTVGTVARVYWDFADFTGYRIPFPRLRPVREAGEFTFDLLEIPLNPRESTSRFFSPYPNDHASVHSTYFGLHGLAILLPLSFGFLVAWIVRRVPRELGLLALALPVYIVTLAFLYRYNPLIGRFLITPVALTVPLAGWIASRRLLAIGVAAFASLGLLLTQADDRLKPSPVRHNPALWAQKRPLGSVMAEVEARVPAGSRVGVVAVPDAWTYPLFGQRLEYEVVYLPRADPLGHAERANIRWALFSPGIRVPVREGWESTVVGDERWRLAGVTRE